MPMRAPDACYLLRSPPTPAAADVRGTQIVTSPGVLMSPAAPLADLRGGHAAPRAAGEQWRAAGKNGPGPRARAVRRSLIGEMFCSRHDLSTTPPPTATLRDSLQSRLSWTERGHLTSTPARRGRRMERSEWMESFTPRSRQISKLAANTDRCLHRTIAFLHRTAPCSWPVKRKKMPINSSTIDSIAAASCSRLYGVCQ